MWLTLYYQKILGDGEINEQYIRMTVIFLDFVGISPLNKNAFQ